MAALTNPGTNPTEFAGNKKILVFDDLSIGSASDTLTLTAAANGCDTIHSVMVSTNAGVDAAFTAASASFSGLVITVTSVEQDGTASTAWSDTTVNLWVIVSG